MSVDKVLSQVRNRKEAEEVVTRLLEVYSTDTAFDRALSEAQVAKQTPTSVLKRKVNNLFRSLETRRG